MYDFIRIQYFLGRITADTVQFYAPWYITSEQAQTIIESGVVK